MIAELSFILILTGKLFIDSLDSEHETASDLNWIGSVGDPVEAGLGDGPGQHRGRRRTVSSLLVG